MLKLFNILFPFFPNSQNRTQTRTQGGSVLKPEPFIFRFQIWPNIFFFCCIITKSFQAQDLLTVEQREPFESYFLILEFSKHSTEHHGVSHRPVSLVSFHMLVYLTERWLNRSGKTSWCVKLGQLCPSEKIPRGIYGCQVSVLEACADMHCLRGHILQLCYWYSCPLLMKHSFMTADHVMHT